MSKHQEIAIYTRIEKVKDEYERLRKKYPKHFTEENHDRFMAGFHSRILNSLMSEFLKIDRPMNLQREIAIPFIQWRKSLMVDFGEIAFGNDSYAESLWKRAEILKLIDLKVFTRPFWHYRSEFYLDEYRKIHPAVKGVWNKKSSMAAKIDELSNVLWRYLEKQDVKKALKQCVGTTKPSDIAYELIAAKHKKSPLTIRDYVKQARKQRKLDVERTMKEMRSFAETSSTS